MNEYVVVDASAAVKWLAEEVSSNKATALAWHLENEGKRPVTSPCMPFEVADALHRRAARRDLELLTATRCIQGHMTLGIMLHETPQLHRGEVELASQLAQGVFYDAASLPLTESLGCDLGTADRRFQRAAGRDFNYMR